ncbi:MAG: hypothetical protein ACREB3_17770 [Burkholderiales bacterium]
MRRRVSKPKLPKLTEADVTRQVCDLMNAKGYRCMRLQSGMFAVGNRLVRVGERGLPDWLFLRPPGVQLGWTSTIFVEIKAPGREPDAKQRAWHADAARARLLSTWTDDIDDFRRWLEERGL